MRANEQMAAWRRNDEQKRLTATAQVESAVVDIANRTEPLDPAELDALDQTLAAAQMTRSQFGQRLEAIETIRALEAKLVDLEKLDPVGQHDKARRQLDAVLARHQTIIMSDLGAMDRWKNDRHESSLLVHQWGCKVTDLRNWREQLKKLQTKHADTLAAV